MMEKSSPASENLDSLFHTFGNLQLNNNIPSSAVPVPVPVPLYSPSIWGNTYYGPNTGAGAFATRISDHAAALILTPNRASQANPFQNRTTDASARFRLVNEILLIAKDRDGSHSLQQELFSSRDCKLTALVFEMVYVYTLEVMTNEHARFVFGKLLETCNQHQLQLITLRLTSQDELLLNAAADDYGSSSIKKLIRVLARSRLIIQVMQTLRRFFRYLMVTKPGSSIILQCLDALYRRNNDSIYQAALEHCLTLANNDQGCISLNKFIDEMRGPRRRQILHLICRNAAFLAKNPFGNYVVQHVLGLENPELIETICFSFQGHYVDLSLTKCGSFVIEKCFKYPNMGQYVVQDFLCSNRIAEVANDRYGNYVIQTALRESLRVDGGLHERLVMKLQEHLQALRLPYGSKVYNLMTNLQRPGLK